MANEFSITPADPLGTQQKWAQTLSNTEILHQDVQLNRQKLQQQAFVLQQEKKQEAADAQFTQLAKEVSPDMPMSEYFGKLAGLAAQTGDLKQIQQLGSLASVAANRESLAQARADRADYYHSMETDRRAKALQSFLPMISRSAQGLDIANGAWRSMFGEDMPVYKTIQASGGWTPEAGAAIRANFDKGMTEYQKAEEERKRTADEKRAGHANAALELRKIAETAREKDRAERLTLAKKHGGKLPMVGNRELLQAGEEIKKFKPDATPESLKIASMEIADEAKNAQIKDGGSYSDNLARAIALHAQEGDFKSKPGGWFSDDSTTYTSKTDKALAAGAPKAAAPKAAKAPPRIGTIEKGYRYKGGDPTNQSSWEKV